MTGNGTREERKRQREQLNVDARKNLAKAKVVQIVMDAVAACESECRAGAECWPYTTALEEAADALRRMVTDG